MLGNGVPWKHNGLRFRSDAPKGNVCEASQNCTRHCGAQADTRERRASKSTISVPMLATGLRCLVDRERRVCFQFSLYTHSRFAAHVGKRIVLLCGPGMERAFSVGNSVVHWSNTKVTKTKCTSFSHLLYVRSRTVNINTFAFGESEQNSFGFVYTFYAIV